MFLASGALHFAGKTNLAVRGWQNKVDLLGGSSTGNDWESPLHTTQVHTIHIHLL